MAIVRLILLVVVLGGLTLLLLQNWSPALSIVFLGVRTQALPLSVWILFSTVAGALTTVAIASLFELSNYFAIPKRPTPFKSDAPPPRTSQSRREEATPRPEPPPASNRTTTSKTEDVSDDWETDTSSDDWEFEENIDESRRPQPQNQKEKDSDVYERQQQPKSSYKSGSVYSYSYQEPKNSGVGKTESVYDADYRVIIPPYQPPAEKQADEDDWGFIEDDFEDEDERPRR